MLNRKYPSRDQDHFFLFHRPRRWNAGEGLWMGYERKRGKARWSSTPCSAAVHATAFPRSSGETAILPAIKYVITLDTDTQLPRDAARQLVGHDGPSA